ncbi:outer membrane protein OmpX [Brenneria populi subsp. brevivirga]|uniref:Outer membrane protein X n=1 Tax=Brenneria populi TaxID=1505588 RepID=A0ABU6JK55_9GAMM|nr:outer membrane protein OmpX [Brenneria populi subsp. brevivirga]MEC5341079.1 outer membrane protein OmpX [Brenneria populi Li et al. 2015]
MKKIVCLSAVACLLGISAGSVFAGQSTVSAGYAQGDAQGVVNKAKGFNLKYRYEWDNSPLGAIGSFTYLEDSGSSASGYYNKGQYMGFTGGPAYRLNDWASIYGVVGFSHGKYTYNAPNGTDNNSNDDYGFTYGAGLQFNPIQDVALDVGYEQSRIRSVDVGTWAVGVGYRF